jgi:predicted amino acid-binding ACT domain protein
MVDFIVGNTGATTGAEYAGMVATYRFRLEVVDQPGTLARITDVLAAAGGNVASIDIHQPDDGMSIDEIVLTAPDGWDVTAVVAALDEVDGVHVLQDGIERRTGDPIVNALTWARVMVAADPATHELELTRAILEVTGASLAWTAEPTGDALAAAKAVVQYVTSLPAEVGTALDGPAWLLAVPDDEAEPRVVAFAARPAAARFSASEIARLGALVRLRRALAGRGAVVPG